MMKKKITLALLALLTMSASAKETTISSPNGNLSVTINDNGGKATYAVILDGQQVLLPSALGFKADFGDFTQGLTIKEVREEQLFKKYHMRQVKRSEITFVANQQSIIFTNTKGQQMTVEMYVSDNDIAFRYVIPRQQKDNPKCAVIQQETTAFSLPDGTTTFICPQITPWTGWERTKPSYEEEYVPDAPMNVKSKFGQGYTFPCLFKETVSNPEPLAKGKKNKKQHVEENVWVLISETGVSSQYCGSHLSDYHSSLGGEGGGSYSIAFPQPGENNGAGSTTAAIPLPGETPWRTITIGRSLKPIVETTIAYDVVDPLYQPSEDYKSGRYTWSWLIWQDASINWNDQIKFIDLAGAMGYEYCLVDGCWDTEIGRERMPELSKYAQSKGVSLLLWYNSNGAWNDAPQTPRGRMDTGIARDKEMRWMKEIGVKGIKVDFFGGDKQETMKLYEDILFDANRYGLQVIFHGCTLPRGWECMYPNFVSSEAVLASENVYFSDYHAKQQPFQLTMHPFCRNAVATMDWGGVIMNKYLSKDNKSRHQRQTTDAFELATAFTNQAAIQCVAIQPNNLQELPQQELDFLKKLPTTWDETRFIDGYPGKYVLLARRHGSQWYIAGLNALKEPLKLQVDLSDYNVTTQFCDILNEKSKQTETVQTTIKKNKKGITTLTIQPNGGVVLF